MANVDGSELIPITDGLKGFNRVVGISPNGKMILIISFSQQYPAYNPSGDLYLINLDSLDSEPIKLAKGLTWIDAAAWLDNTRVVYIGTGPEGHGIYIVNIDGSNPRNILINFPKATPITILSSDKTRVYWNSNVKINGCDCTAVWWTNIDGTGQGKLESNGSQVIYFGGGLAFSPDGTKVAWLPQQDADCDPNLVDIEKYCYRLYVADPSNLENPLHIALHTPENADGSINPDTGLVENTMSLTWWPDNSRVLLFSYPQPCQSWDPPNCSPISFGLFVLDLSNSNSTISTMKSVPIPRMANINIHNFSPDGRKILVTIGYSCETNILDLETMVLSEVLTDRSSVEDSVCGVYWLP